MKRLALVFLAACAIEETESTVTSELDLGTQIGFELEGASLTGSITRVSDPVTASAAGYITFADTGSARAFFPLPTATTFHVWARVIAPSPSSDRISFQFDSQSAITWILPVTSTWTWVQLDSAYTLATGWHSFQLATIAGGVRIDRVLLATSEEFIPITDMFEAESGGLVYPMRIGLQRLPSTHYAFIPNGVGCCGYIHLDTAVPYSGAYTIWGRASIPDADATRWSIGRNGATSYSTGWAPPITSADGWTWSKTQAMWIDPGDVLTIMSTKDGGKVDKFLVTNDTGFRLVESSPPPQSSL